jgi:dihydroorotase
MIRTRTSETENLEGTMMNRRHFVQGAAMAALAAAAHIPGARAAATYDLVIKGGRVIDPARRLDAVRDVAIAGGRIAAVEANIPAGGSMIDARGKIVIPGMIDLHTHCGRANNVPPMALSDGVTCWVDAGSNGADKVDESVAVAKAAPNMGRVLVNIARTGILPEGDRMDISRADVGAARAAIERNRDTIVGVKARLSFNVAGSNDLEAIRRCQAVTMPFNLPVMVHVGQNVSPMARILELLKPGDVVTHLYAPEPNSILDGSGRLFPEVQAARRRGIWFDFGNGQNGHVTWDMAERAIRQGFLPDTLSTDYNANSRSTGVIDLPNVMSKFLLLGVPMDQVVAMVTSNAAKVFPAFRDRGTLNVGAPADVAVMELRQGSFEFLDNYGGKRSGQQRLFPVETVIGGKRAARV